MKKWKLFTFIGIMSILAFIFIACDDGSEWTAPDSDPREPYFGTWVWEEYSITLSATQYILQRIGTYGGYTVTPISWVAIVNTNDATQTDYPSGFRITGYVSTHSGDIWSETGDFFGENFSYFVHRNGKSLLEQSNEHSWFVVLDKKDP